MDIRDKNTFLAELKACAATLSEKISTDDEWDIRGFIDVFKNIYTVSTDTKVISKLLELHLFPHFLAFTDANGFVLELATHQNWYPDMTFINKEDPSVKFAVDLKTTYRLTDRPGFCNGFTLGSHGEYFTDRTSTKNIQYPYGAYSGHFCLGIIYSRAALEKTNETKRYTLDTLENIPAVIHGFTFFAEEKWKIASDKGGSGNTANIGSITCIEDILAGRGVFSRAGEEYFDDYWMNYRKMQVPDGKGGHKGLSSFPEYLAYRGLPAELNTPRRGK